MSFGFVLLMRRMTNKTISLRLLQPKIYGVFGIRVYMEISVVFFLIHVYPDCFIVDILLIVVFDPVVLFLEHFIIFHVIFSMEGVVFDLVVGLLVLRGHVIV